MFSIVIYSFPVAVEIFPTGLKMTLSAKEKSALRCKRSARLVTSGYSALTQHRDPKAFCHSKSKLSLPALQRPCLSITDVTSESGKLKLEHLIRNTQRRLYDRVKCETKGSLILCFTGNVHLPWKNHCLLQLRATRSAKTRGNLIGQRLSGKQYNAISTSASPLDLF